MNTEETKKENTPPTGMADGKSLKNRMMEGITKSFGYGKAIQRFCVYDTNE